MHYRKPIYNELAKYYDITILHSGNKSINNEDKYKEIIVSYKKIGPFSFQEKVLKFANNNEYDAIIAMFDIRWIMNILLSFFHNSKIKFIWWGPWLTNKKYIDKFKIFLANRKHNIIFYCKEHMEEFIKYGVKEDNLFIANNTFDVGERVKSFENKIKNKILFVGSLDSRKQNDVLIKSFSKIINLIDENIILTIIGDGRERDNLKDLVHKLDISNRVSFEGKITDVKILKEYYKESIVSVSFGQAGLAVLQSIGYGVPFITKLNSISGGEKTNIINGYNGFFCEDSKESLSELLLKLCNDIEYTRSLGKNAFNHYTNFCTVQIMVKGIIDSIEKENDL